MPLHLSLHSPYCSSPPSWARVPQPLFSYLNEHPTYPAQSPGQRSSPDLPKPNRPSLLSVHLTYTTQSLPDTRCLLSKGQHFLLCANELLSQLKTWILYNFHFSPFFQNENRVITVVGHLESIPAFILHRLLNNTKIAHSTSH